MNKRFALAVCCLPMLGGCDRLQERLGIANPARVEAEGKAIGGGCRNAGRGLEECYARNPRASKSAIFAGWKEMNEYMMKNNMQALPPRPSADSGSEASTAAPQAEPSPTDAPKAGG